MIKQLIAKCTDYDFKEILESKKHKSWFKSVSAFSNGNGGKLFFGISNDGIVTGIKDAQNDIEKNSELIIARVDPRPIFTIVPLVEDDKTILILNVEAGFSTPYYYRYDGITEAYVRMGSQSVQAPTYILNELILKGTGRTYDSIVTSYKKEDYSFSILESYFKERTNTNFTIHDYISFGLMTKDGYLTNAGLLLANINPYRQSRLFCTKWNGITKTAENETLDDKEFDGSLIKQLNQALEFFKNNTVTKWKKIGLNTVYEYEYDETAILEALVNGIIHRDYNNLGAEVCMNIYLDRIEITSPGGMVSGEKIPESIDFTMESMRRNPIIADVFWKMRYMNRRGSGLAKITSATNQLFRDNKNHVSFMSSGAFFNVKIENSLYNSSIIAKLSDREKKIIEIISTNSKATLVELANKLNVSTKTIDRDTKKLQELGVLSSIGNGRSRIWTVNV
ncbi:MAG: putative DNA binding domain-containing protein [Firmicutes bacterium]|nr:putative DNA binding domain-containing protein [Bacillota bacterium]